MLLDFSSISYSCDQLKRRALGSSQTLAHNAVQSVTELVASASQVIPGWTQNNDALQPSSCPKLHNIESLPGLLMLTEDEDMMPQKSAAVKAVPSSCSLDSLLSASPSLAQSDASSSTFSSVASSADMSALHEAAPSCGPAATQHEQDKLQRTAQVNEASCTAPLEWTPEFMQVGYHSNQGSRHSNEDSAFALTHSALDRAHCASFGVFDGHGGAEAAEFMLEAVPELLLQRSSSICDEGSQAVADVVVDVEHRMRGHFQQQWQPMERDPGSTALVATIVNDTLHVANVGDCRLLLISERVDADGSRAAYVSHTTDEHNCRTNPQEQERIKAAGGYVCQDGYVCSLLEVSRSLGDFKTKAELGEGLIISTPDTYSWKLNPEALFAVAVSDGISSHLDDSSICNMVCKFLNSANNLNDPAYAARELASYAVSNGSADNCSAVVVVLRHTPPPLPPRPRRIFATRKAVEQLLQPS
mmetsp:Transcript_14555/g.31700  ORF Transcript_14555/g.31700 Transcript_14555/m.31700 type:complete len:473 (-) Transcript_14555:1386-2804(-)